MSIQTERSRETPLKPLATSLEDIAHAIYAYDGFTLEPALQAFSHIKRRTPAAKPLDNFFLNKKGIKPHGNL